MAGHNKWSKVKHIKARVDAVKGRVFSKCAHEIALAARAGGPDPAANSRLRTAIDNAKSVSEKLVSIPQTRSVVADPAIARKISPLHDLLDDYYDTLNVFTNFDVADKVLDQLAS